MVLLSCKPTSYVHKDCSAIRGTVSVELGPGAVLRQTSTLATLDFPAISHFMMVQAIAMADVLWWKLFEELIQKLLPDTVGVSYIFKFTLSQ